MWFVIASGLNGTFERKPFEIISELIPLCENISFKTAICKYNGNDACFSKNKIPMSENGIIGGDESYESVDRYNYLN